jgi:hypothetical protein
MLLLALDTHLGKLIYHSLSCFLDHASPGNTPSTASRRGVLTDLVSDFSNCEMVTCVIPHLQSPVRLDSPQPASSLSFHIPSGVYCSSISFINGAFEFVYTPEIWGTYSLVLSLRCSRC